MDLEIWLEMWNGQRFSTLHISSRGSLQDSLDGSARGPAVGYREEQEIGKKGWECGDWHACLSREDDDVHEEAPRVREE